MILDKILKASPASFSHKCKEGEIINFINVDSPKISRTIIQCPGLIVSPIQIILYVIMLFRIFGAIFLFGFGTLILFLVINYFVQKKYVGLMKQELKAKDERLKITTETINSIKILKLYAWDETFLKRVLTIITIIIYLYYR